MADLMTPSSRVECKHPQFIQSERMTCNAQSNEAIISNVYGLAGIILRKVCAINLGMNKMKN
jgi:hypothetical protein